MCEGGSIVIKVTLDLCVREQEGVEGRGSQEVHRNDRLEQQSIPELNFEAGTAFAQDGHKVVLPGADGLLSCVSLVIVGGSQLIIDSLVVEKGNECVGYLVV